MEVFKFIVTVASTGTFGESDMQDAIDSYDSSVCAEVKLTKVIAISDDCDQSL
jgi:hypothetical protein